MTYKYYRFPNKQTVPPASAWPANVSYYEVGRIGNNNAVYNAFGVEIQPQTFLSGWHVNVSFNGTVNLNFINQYEITVNSPKVIWLGQTV